MDDDIGQPYLLDVPFAIDLVERDGWRFEIRFDADVTARDPERIAAFAHELAAADVGTVVAQDDGRTVLTRGRTSIERMQTAVLQARTAVGGRIGPPTARVPDGRGPGR
jgi:hypothetical protein